jgi:ABC-2 type transport system ATP-binding protein
MAGLAIEVRGLRKSYGNLEAVRGIDLTVEAGRVFALLGPNGAGKTTTVEILEGHRHRTSGEVTVLGHDPARAERRFKEKIGIVLQETGVNRFLTVTETIDQFRSFYPSPLPTEEIIEIVGLTEKKDSLVRRLSGGQQRRLDVAVGLAGNPELLFLDEPTTGFDPSARRNAWQMIKNLKDLGKTILLTTHYMDEAQHLADNVAIINQGLIVAEGTPQTLGGDKLGHTKISFALGEGSDEIPVRPGDRIQRDGGSIEIETTDPVQSLHDLTDWAIRRDIDLSALTVSLPSLEDVYLDLTDKKEEPAE